MGSLTRRSPTLVVLVTTALCCAQPAAAPTSASARLAESIAGGTTTFVLDGRLFRSLEEEGIKVEALRPATADGRVVEMPLSGAYLEYGRGTGYAFEQGGVRFRGPHGSVALRHIVLNTAKGRLNATVAGRSVVLANPAGVDGRPNRYGLEVAVRSLLLTGAGARTLDRALGVRHLFVAGAKLARARIVGETDTVPVGPASLEFSFDEAFRQKLAALGIAVAGTGAAAQSGATPLAFSFPDAGGSGNRGLSRGGVTSPSALQLTQGVIPDQHEATIGISMSFESRLIGTARSRWPSARTGAPLGEADFSQAKTIDPATGLFGAPPTPVTLSSYGVDELNEAFGSGTAKPFSAGEPLGTLAVSGRLGR